MMDTMLLPVPLSETEVALKAENLAGKVKELSDLEAEKKTAMAGFNQRHKAIEREVIGLARAVRDKAEDREVEIQQVRNEERMTIDTVRADTGEVVESRAMNSTERTRPMFPGGSRTH